MRRNPPQVLFAGAQVCVEGCLERSLLEAAGSVAVPAAPTPHRIPLGLLMLSRQQLSANQLRMAVEAQQRAGHGRIGEWIQSLGFADEDQITAALARQWSCPVWKGPLSSTACATMLPAGLLCAFNMLPVFFAPSSSTLHIAFGGAIDYPVLYAIEQIVNCRTIPCLLPASVLRNSLQQIASERNEDELVFDRVRDTDELVRIVRSYAVRVSASEIRLAPCGSFRWARLLNRAREHMDLLIGALPETVRAKDKTERGGAAD